jgi:integrase
MASLQLKFIQQFIDRHGHPRFYFRRPGFPRRALPGLPFSEEFRAAYAEAMAGQPPVVRGPCECRPGTMAALRVSYLSSANFLSLAPSTQSYYRGIIDRLCEEAGNNRVALLERRHVVSMMAERSDKPERANGLRKVLRMMMQHAVEIGMRQDDPTRDVRAIRTKSDGFHSWTEEEIAQFESVHPVGTKARLALALLLYTGQRRSDVARMGRQHVRDGLLHVKQDKTGAELFIPIHAELQQIIAASSVGQMTFLVTEFGKPFSSVGFSNWFRKQCDKAGLPECTSHGLRKACARRLADAGCSQHEIAAITGHASLKEIVRYTKGADQLRLARAAMQKMRATVQENETRSSTVNADDGLTKKAKIS